MCWVAACFFDLDKHRLPECVSIKASIQSVLPRTFDHSDADLWGKTVEELRCCGGKRSIKIVRAQIHLTSTFTTSPLSPPPLAKGCNGGSKGDKGGCEVDLSSDDFDWKPDLIMLMSAIMFASLVVAALTMSLVGRRY